MSAFSTPFSRRALLGAALAGGVGAAAGLRPGTAHAADDLTVTAQLRQSSRDLLTSVSSPAVNYAPRVRILLPDGYDANPRRHYPVIYLFHGSMGDCDSYTDNTSLRALTAGREVIVVMPDGGKGGWCCDHWHSSVWPRNWETFHVSHVVPAVDRNLRTLGWARGRAAVGFSAGAYGAAMYAGRNPWTFGAVSCYSGPLDSFDMQWRREMSYEPTFDGEAQGAIYGTAPGQEKYDDLVFRNPATYASTLKDHRIRLTAGDDPGYESNMMRSTLVFRDALVKAGATDLGFSTIAGGQHDMVNADQALRRDLPSLIDWLAPARDM